MHLRPRLGNGPVATSRSRQFRIDRNVFPNAISAVGLSGPPADRGTRRSRERRKPFQCFKGFQECGDPGRYPARDARCARSDVTRTPQARDLCRDGTQRRGKDGDVVAARPRPHARSRVTISVPVRPASVTFAISRRRVNWLAEARARSAHRRAGGCARRTWITSAYLPAWTCWRPYARRRAACRRRPQLAGRHAAERLDAERFVAPRFPGISDFARHLGITKRGSNLSFQRRVVEDDLAPHDAPASDLAWAIHQSKCEIRDRLAPPASARARRPHR
jgi:hypothetical protein